MTDVRELLESAANIVPADAEAPLDAVLAAGRRRVRGRRLAIAGAGVATAAAVLVAGLPLHRTSSLSPSVDAMTSSGGATPVAVGGETCPGVSLAKLRLPGRTVTVDNGDWPTEQAADLLGLTGWPRAVPYSAAHWTVVTNGTYGILVASLPGAPQRYLSIRKGPNNSWFAGVPCTPR